MCNCLKSDVKPPEKPDYSSIYTSPTYENKTIGECKQGTYVRMYVPENPYQDNGKLKVVIYLHGFNLGAWQIYGSHLEHLVKQGYYVIYPNYQHGFCEFSSPIYNLFGLIEEALSPYPFSPQTWLKIAINSVKNAYEALGLLADNLEIDTYLFGHSLGGLFALSWPSYCQFYSPCDPAYAQMLPKQIIVADPVPDSKSNIPNEIRKIIDQHGGFKDVVSIEYTGAAINVPVAILHGNDDDIIKPQDWKIPFNYIATKDKKMYLSFTDDHGSHFLNPGSNTLHANHEQATVNTSFVPNYIADLLFNGVGQENDLNWRYIWYALDQVIRSGAVASNLSFKMGNWSDGHPVKPIQVYLPTASTKWYKRLLPCWQ